MFRFFYDPGFIHVEYIYLLVFHLVYSLIYPHTRLNTKTENTVTGKLTLKCQPRYATAPLYLLLRYQLKAS